MQLPNLPAGMHLAPLAHSHAGVAMQNVSMTPGSCRRAPHAAGRTARSFHSAALGPPAACLSLLIAAGASADSRLIELSQDDAQWVMPAKNYSPTRYSGLDEIN